MKHRAEDRDEPSGDPVDPIEPGDTTVFSTSEEDDYRHDLAELLNASTRLREIGEQVDEGHRAAIALAVRHAVNEATRIADARATRSSRRSYIVAVTVAVLLSLVVSLPFAVTGYVRAQEASTTAAQLAAGDSASAEVLSARASSLQVVRRDLAQVVNPARVKAGLSACPDPGPQANAYQVSWVIGACAGELRTFADLAKRGRPVPGVNAPDPDSGSFPRPAY